jgi:hypothetical protein
MKGKTMTNLTDDLIESLFDEAVMAMFKEPTIKYALTTDQKRRVIDALDTVVEDNGKIVTISMLFFRVTLDASGDAPQMSIDFDVNQLLAFHARLPKN